MSGTKALRSGERVAKPQSKPKPKARFSRADEKAALEQSMQADIDTMENSNAESMQFHRQSVGRRTMRKLARGRFSVQAEIDLHGMTVAEARPRLADFIDYSVKQRHLCEIGRAHV